MEVIKVEISTSQELWKRSVELTIPKMTREQLEEFTLELVTNYLAKEAALKDTVKQLLIGGIPSGYSKSNTGTGETIAP